MLDKFMSVVAEHTQNTKHKTENTKPKTLCSLYFGREDAALG